MSRSPINRTEGVHMDYATVLIKIPKEKFDVLTSDEFYTLPAECKEWGSRAIRNGIPIGNYTSSLATTMKNTPKKGSWVWKPKGYNLLDGNLGDWCCSNCNKVLDKNVPSSFLEHALNYSYCPYCGNTTEAIEVESEDSD